MANWIKNITGAASKAGVKGAAQADQALNAGSKVTSAIPIIKWGTPLALILAILLLGGSTVGGVGNGLRAIADPESCAGVNSADVKKYAEEAGITLTEEQNEGISGIKGCGRSSGAGYTGETYPPTQGTVTGTFAEIADIRGGNPHTGLDIAGACGDPIYAFAGGTVTNMVKGTEAKSGGGGFVYPMGLVIIEHTPEFSTAYYHLKGSTTTVKIGDIVSAGDQIADQWSNGRSSGCHLHIETYVNGKTVDPLPILQEAGYPYAKGVYYSESDFPPKPTGTGGAMPTGTPSTPDEAKAYAKALVKAKGWPDSEFTNCLLPLWIRESGWRVTAINPAFAPSQANIPENQAYGIPQSGPGIKMASAGADWKTNAGTQIRWGIGYIEGRYKTPCGAWAHSEAHNWY